MPVRPPLLPLRSRRGPLFAFAALVFAAATHAADWAPNLTFAASWHDNITNAPTTDDQLDSLQLNADVLASNRYALGRDDALHATAHLAADWWPRYHTLFSGAVGARLEWRHTFGVGTLAPTFSVEAGGDIVGARERGREGTSSAATVALRKRLNDHWRAAIVHQIGRHEARLALYDRASWETSVELGYDVSPASRFTLTTRYRDGNVISYSSVPDADLESVAIGAMPVSTFDRPHIAYAFDARTWSGRLAYLRALDPSSAIVVAYEIGKSRAQPVRFTNQQLSVAVVHQF